ncbi:MAG TPA: response regulator transcription factor [Solirubrobacteraceae bacterium]|nr:response regulator transcription factor [Solirubrobacteraceae bacterium]
MSIVLATPPSRSQPSRGERLQMPGEQVRVLVADGEPVYLTGLTYVLQMAGLDVVTTASQGDDLFRKVRAHHPDVVVVDADMAPSRDGTDPVGVVCQLRDAELDLAILILSRSADDQQVLEALGERPGGFGYLLKPKLGDLEDFVGSVRRVARGGTAIDPTVVSRLAGRGGSHDPLADLTTRELEVLALIADGRSNRWIADHLVVTLAAIERHITSIFAKLALATNGEDHRRVLAALRYCEHRRAGVRIPDSGMDSPGPRERQVNGNGGTPGRVARYSQVRAH